MPEFDKDSQEKEDNKKAFVISLDSDSIPEPSIAFRGLAFILDYILVILLATLIILQVILPLNPSFSLEALNDWLNTYLAWAESNTDTAAPILNDSTQAILLLITESFSIIFILYFCLIVLSVLFAGCIIWFYCLLYYSNSGDLADCII